MTDLKICAECGKLFKPNSAIQKFCNDVHYRTCPVCNNVFAVPRDKLGSNNAVCSKKCQYDKLKSNPKYDESNTKVCEACGELFTPRSPKQRFCTNKHYIKCAVCNKIFLAKQWQLSAKTKTCSIECGAILSHKTYQEHYDKNTNPKAHSELVDKIKNTMIQKYGVENALDREGRHKFKVEDKFEQKYGVRHPSLSPNIMKKREQTVLDRYGSTCPLTNPEVAAKSKATLLSRYEVDNYAKSVEFLKQVITDPGKACECKLFRDNPRKYVQDNFPDRAPTLQELSEKCGIRDSSVGYVLDRANCQDIVTFTYSRMEDELYSFLVEELGQNANIWRNTFKIIAPYELDLYLPDYALAIECNPTITHNSTISGWSDHDDPKSSRYHLMKTDLCEDKGIFLFHIFGYDWTWHSDIIKSMIRNLIHTSKHVIYARNTTLKEVSDEDSIMFLKANHRQGGTHSKIRLGLYYNEELVSLMTFSKMRPTIGLNSSIQNVNCYELARFCSKLDTNVIGGASKLFNYFIKTYNPEEIRSFSDRAHTKGLLYDKLGFKFDHSTDPGYMWVELRTDRGFSRNNAQKANIRKFLNDDNIDLSKTEVQIMSEHNFVQVFDSGVKLWIWRKERD